MFDYIKKLFQTSKKVEVQKNEIEKEKDSIFSTDIDYRGRGLDVNDILRLSIKRSASDFIAPEVKEQGTMDAAPEIFPFTPLFGGFQGRYGIPVQQFAWFANQGFIGYQLCAIISQHWLVDKCCSMPAMDAVRHGFEITVNDGREVDVEVLEAIKKADVKYSLKKNLVEFVYKGRMYGIRIALFEVNSPDPFYYEKPFNPDGVKPGSYKGISQVDPFWITPELDADSSANPASRHFYEPTWWRVNGRRIHRTHLIIMRNSELGDILKPTYIYGGIPIPQKIYERVYAAERTANEAPMLALTKRTKVIKTDLAQAIANQSDFDQRMDFMACMQNNYGTQVVGESDTVEQFDTTLADLDAVIMTQYQLVAAASGVPATKLLGTSPKGFGASGEYEESNYHEELESIQSHHLTPLIERHHLLLIRSEISPHDPFTVSPVWNPLDSTTKKGKAENNKIKAETDLIYVNAGALTPEDIRDRLINDRDSGYNGLETVDLSSEPDDENNPDDDEFGIKENVQEDPQGG